MSYPCIALLGSQALSINRPELVTHEPKDIDILGTYDDVMSFIKSEFDSIRALYPHNNASKIIAKNNDGRIIEAELAWPGSNSEELLELIKDNTEITFEPFGHSNIPVICPSVNILYMLKMSHRFKKNSPHFLKTMRDIQNMRKVGAKIPEKYIDFFERREEETYNYTHPNLKTTKENFFNSENIEYVYDHDTIHEAVKHLDQPAYNYFKPDTEEVFCSKDLFEQTDLTTRLYAVLEESYVLALERSQIPMPGKLTPYESFLKALEKVCTSITSGWFREFAWEHYDEVVALYSDNYVDKFNQGVQFGLVKSYDYTVKCLDMVQF